MAKPWKVRRLDPEKPFETGLKLVLRSRVKEVFSYGAKAVKKNEPDAVHDMRVSARRLKAVLTIFDQYFMKKAIGKHRSRLQTLLRALGDVRDTDIFIEFLLEYKRSATERMNPDALERVIELERNKRGAYRTDLKHTLARLRDARFKQHFRKFLSDTLSSSLARARASGCSFRDMGRRVAPTLLDAFCAHAKDVTAHPDSTKRLHKMRIDGKRVRYGMEQFTDAFSAQYEQCLEEVKRLLDVMGSIHDCDVNLPRLMRRIRAVGDHTHSGGTDAALAGALRALKERRSALFETMRQTLECWQREDFRTVLVRSMESAADAHTRMDDQ
ncbi:MAG TPA: CHAD domain-containing protein [Bacteroidota bacterium]|nr:CHAD domain-containing protein [Bacteroidota bacterium]